LARHVGSRDPQSGAIATAILIGDRGALDPEVERRLQEAGTYHVIAISGGNIAILAGLVLGGLWWMGLGARWSAGAAIATLALFAFVAGGGASVVRATLMACVYLSLRLIDQRTSPLHALALTGVALLVVSPLAIADVGFWLTFGATAAIVTGAARPRLPSFAPVKAMAAVVLASASAEAVLMPVGALMFQRVTVAGLVLNLAAVPSMAVVQLAAMATAAADAAGLDLVASGAGWVAHQAAYGLVWSATLVDLAPWSTWRVPSPSLWVVAAYYTALLLWVLKPHHEGREGHEGIHRAFRKPASCASCSSWLLFGWIALAPPTLVRVHGDGRLHLTAIDVGQGDAFLVTLPNGRTAMVDTGGVTLRGGFDIGDRVIGPALRARGIGRLDYLVVTHGDPDHIGGAWSLARDLSPAEVWTGVPVANHEPTARLSDVAARRRAAWRTLQRGDRIDIGGVELRVLHPPPPDWERQRVRNNDSVVLALGFGRVSLLLTGDIERDVEAELGPALDLREVVVLKAAHHGSGTSSGEAFLAAARPALVVISAGRGNPYGHPVPYVLDRYKAMGAEVFRTDQDGQVEIITDGHNLTAESYTGRRWELSR
jgi:competence protein ComEC